MHRKAENKFAKLIETILTSDHRIYLCIAIALYIAIFFLPKQPWVAGLAGVGSAILCFLWYPNFMLRNEKLSTKE
ncbi:hypothetical protein GCM10007852_25450 [Agaribacter marinus]|uniref:Uncharacterized protein n=1 Tax=Agaribacter marinus TaxID=1431249 RepID=A0AA37SXP1_9ALTE|nr:hypothetical protein GCM10007852_25450 [Agaribacter marinus]